METCPLTTGPGATEVPTVRLDARVPQALSEILQGSKTYEYRLT